MNILCRSVSLLKDLSKIEGLEDKYDIDFSKQFKEFFVQNNGGIPLKKELNINGEEYEIRCFLSFNDNDYNSIKKPLEVFQKVTNGKIVPFAKDSGDNYYCVNLETGKVYYWDKEDDSYYILTESFSEFVVYLK